MKLSIRLESAIKYTEGFKKLMDVGCDHAYLPIEAVNRGYVKKAIASDNKEDPYYHALENIKLMHSEKNVEAILSEGLEKLDDTFDIVSILGMGGNLIVEILEKADLTNVKRLILGPNSDPATVREYLEKNHLMIEAEEFVKDNDKFYQLMIVGHGEMTLSKNERRFGPMNLANQSPEFVEYINKLLVKLVRGRFQARELFTIKNLDSEIKSLRECLK